ncbi:MAG: DNA cytosine methyltransferase, partial [Opitutaceae bacterium]|nr:DNA cytosine methyltransferase [Opitutaceae bacterium]
AARRAVWGRGMNAFALDNRMTVVLFAGMGGGCDGLEQAGFHVHVAINHDPVAVAVHKARHPHTKHLTCDVFEADPRVVTGGRGVRALHASPDCTHFSVAKGSKPVSKRRRSLAWVVCRWMGTVRPEVVTMENVQEITTWGPLIAKRDPATGRAMRLDGTVAAKGERIPLAEQWLVPDPRYKGRIWRAWLRHVEGLSYRFEHRVIVCADHGIPTIRKRFFGIARADGGDIEWPERTHAPRKDAKRLGLKAWVGAHTIIDWSLPVKSIFGRKKPLAEATLRRTARGVMRYVVNAAKPFIVPITHAGDSRVQDAAEPLRTLTTAHRGEMAVAVPHLSVMRNSRQPTYAADEPSHAFTAGGANHALVSAALIRTDQHSAAARNGVMDAEEPVNTLHTSSGLAVLGATIVGAGGRAAQTEPRDLDDPLTTTSTKEDRVLVAATMIQAGYGERPGQAPRTLDIEEPAATQVAGGSKAAMVAAFLAQHNNDSRRIGGVHPGREAEEPVAALTVAPQVGVVAAALGDMHGTRADARDAADPLGTVAASGNHAHLILAFLQKYFGTGGQDQAAQDPLHALTAKARHGLVTVKVRGQDYVLTDIGMRMLEPEEGAAAHGFAPGALPDEIEIAGPDGVKRRRRLTKTEKYHLVGNSVPPEMIRLLASLNVRWELAMEAAE